MEELPTLSVKNTLTNNTRSVSPFSSVSTTSVGGCDEVETKIQRGYYTLESVTVRPYFKCLCERCGSEIPTESEWNTSKCNKGTKLKKSGVQCDVTRTKLLRVGKKKFSISYIETDVWINKKRNRRAHGWVLSKNLNRCFNTSPSLSRPRKTVEVERTRSRSASVRTQDSPFSFGDLVLVRNDAAADWVRGEVRKECPLLILAEGASKPQRYHVSNIKNIPTRKFVTAQNVIVRTQKQVDNWEIQTLKPGTNVSVAYMEGFEGRITAPVNGWISMREAHSLNVVEFDWTYSHQNPTILVKNLPGDITETKLRDTLFYKGYVEAFTITFQRRGDEFRALVSLRNSRKAVSQLIEKKQIALDDQQLEISWDMRYLKNLAAWRLSQTLKK